jgi:hypothetical protein
MSKLPVISGAECVKALGRVGFVDEFVELLSFVGYKRVGAIVWVAVACVG